MSRKGDCYDNAPIDSFRGILKNESLHHCRFSTRQEAMRKITEYREIFIAKGVRKGLRIFRLPLTRNNISKSDVRHVGFRVRY